MTNEQIQFIANIFTELNAMKNICRDLSHNLEHHPSKNYWTLNLAFQSANSEYKDCVVFFEGDSFDGDKILKDLSEITEKVRAISK